MRTLYELVRDTLHLLKLKSELKRLAPKEGK